MLQICSAVKAVRGLLPNGGDDGEETALHSVWAEGESE